MNPILALDSILPSPVKGMGLERGVPKNSMQSKDGPGSSSDEKFEFELLRSSSSEKPKRSSHVRDDETKEDSLEISEKDVLKSSEKRETKIESDADSEVPNPNLGLVVPEVKGEISDAGLSVDAEALQAVATALKSAEPALLEDGLEKRSALMVADKMIAPQVVDVASAVSIRSTLPNLQKVPGEAITGSKDLEDPLVEEGTHSASDISISDLVMGSESLENEEANVHSSLEKAVSGLESKPTETLKGFSDKLWIGQQIENFQNSKPEFSESVSLATSDANASVTVRHLADDMKPIVTKAVMNQEGGEMIVNLKPGHLGAVKVQIQVNGDQVRLSISADQPHTRQVLQSQMTELRNQFSSHGMKLEEVSLVVQGGSAMRDAHLSQEDKRFHSEDHRGQKDESQKRESFSHQESRKHKNFKDERAFNYEGSAWT